MSEYDSQRPQDAGQRPARPSSSRVCRWSRRLPGSNIPYVQVYDTQTGKPLGGQQVVNKHTVVKTKTKSCRSLLRRSPAAPCGALLVLALIMSGTLTLAAARTP